MMAYIHQQSMINRGHLAATNSQFWSELNAMHTVFLVLKDMPMDEASSCMATSNIARANHAIL
jgi:hypothetical protein